MSTESTDDRATGHCAGGGQEDQGDPGAEERADAPALEGPFVAVAPGVWVRADRVTAVTRADPGAPGDQCDRTRSRVHVLGADPAGPASGFASPHPVDALVTALRLAEHREEVRRLANVLRRIEPLVGASARRR